MSSDQIIIEFTKRTANNRGKKGRGIRVGEWLAVSYSEDFLSRKNDIYQIYRLDTGRPYNKMRFSDVDSAVAIAEMLSFFYEKFFPIWTEYPNADIPALSRWTVRNGLEILRLLEILNVSKIFTDKEINRYIGTRFHK